MQLEVAGSVKKELVGGAKVKKERMDEQAANLESLQKKSESVETDDLWLQLKLEINEMMEQDMTSSFDDDMCGVRIKEEILEGPHQDIESLETKSYNSELAISEEAQEQSSSAPHGQTPVAKRRRLTRGDWPKTLQNEVASSVKKERAFGVKVKRERIDERQGSVERRQQESMEMDDLWLQVRKEINKQRSVQSTSGGQHNLKSDMQLGSSLDMAVALKADGQQDSSWKRSQPQLWW
eukprot:Skav223201  [mRNA]  locus=scaffold1624:68153:68863:- [translate_table: standard]